MKRRRSCPFSHGKEGECLCAGINRHGVENARVLRERTSDSPGPEFCAAHREVHSEA